MFNRLSRFPGAPVLLALVGALLVGSAGAEIATGTKASSPWQQRAARTLAALPLLFEANAGQTDARVQFLTRGSGYTGFLTAEETVLALRSRTPPTLASKPRTLPEGKPSVPSGTTALPSTTVLRTRLVGGNPAPKLVGEKPVATPATYLKGNDPHQWCAAPQYERVRAKGVYPGIDLVHYGNQEGRLEYDFVVQPGADPQAIRMALSGAEQVRLDATTGDLVLRTPGGEIRQQRPVVYQERGGHREPVAGSFVLAQTWGEVSFAVGAYDRNRPLVIDPTLLYSTYLGGNSSNEYPYSVAAEGNGIVYVAGFTDSANFPVLGQFQGNQTGRDAFLTKLDTKQSGIGSLLYSTYLGGSSRDEAQSVSVEGSGIVYVTGYTDSANFPVLGQFQEDQTGEAQDGFQPGRDAFLTELDTKEVGSASLVYSTYLGGSTYDFGYSVAAAGAGIVYVAGYTRSTDFPVLGEYQGPQSGLNPDSLDAFVTKLDTTKTGAAQLLYSTYLQGSFVDVASAVAAGGSGIVYVTGWTESPDFPLKGDYQGSNVGPGVISDAFLAKLDTTKTGTASLLYSTYLGGLDIDTAHGIATEGNGIVFIGGTTYSPDFPVKGEYQGDPHWPQPNAFLTKLDTTKTGVASLLYSTYLGGTGSEDGQSIALEGNGIVYVVGSTQSADFPLLYPYQSKLAGSGAFLEDAFLTKLDTKQTGVTSLLYSTYLGGGGFDRAYAVSAEGNGIVYVAGRTGSSDFPLLNYYQGDQLGEDGFVSVFSAEIPYGLVAQPRSSTEIRLDWTDPSTTETGFKIEMKIGANGSFSQVDAVGPTAGVGSGVTYTRGGLSPTTLYVFRVRAYTGTVNASYSNEAFTTTLQNPPAAPSDLTATAISQTQIDLAWQDHSSNETGFRLQRKAGLGSYVQVAVLPVNSTSYGDTSGLTANTTYTYRVLAYNTGGPSAYSNEATATTLPNPPTAPSGLTATAISQTQIDLAWQDHSNNETGFRLQRKAGPGSYVQVAVLPANSVNFGDTNGLTANTTYTYRVFAYNTGGPSAYSNEAVATTSPAAAPAPASLRAKAYEGPFIRLVWTDRAPNEQAFIIERSTDSIHFGVLAVVGGRYGVGNYRTYEDSAVTDSVRYYYRVRAVTNGLPTDPSNLASAVAQTAPATPSDLTLKAYAGPFIRLTWTDNADNETGFRIERSTDGVNFAGLTSTGARFGVGGSRSYEDRRVTTGQRYFYRVFAFNQFRSGYSDVATTVTLGGGEVPVATCATDTLCRVARGDAAVHFP